MSGVGLSSVPMGLRFLYRLKWPAEVLEDVLVERSPSGTYVKFGVLGWVSESELAGYELLEILTPPAGGVEKPERKCRNAPAGSPQLEAYMNDLGLYR